jgi:hypothetical protein
MKAMLLLMALAGASGTLPAADYALSLPVTVPQDAALVSLQLPAEVYQVVRRPDLGDVRVLDGAGQPVPMALLPARAEPQERRSARPLVPLPAVPAAAGEPSVVVSGQGAGASVRVEIHGAPADAPAPGPGFLIDTGGFDAAVDALELDWTGVPVFEAALRVSASDDLSRWRTVVPRAGLLAAGAPGARIEQRRIALPALRARYLRLEWLEAPPAVALAGATLVHSGGSAQPDRAWIELTGERDGDLVRYVSPGLFPVGAVALLPAGAADVVSGTLESRATSTQRWRWRAQLLGYRLTQQGETLEAPPQPIATTRDPLWRLRLDAAAADGPVPLLRLGWRPQTLVFVTRGEGPYRLVAGHDTDGPAWQPPQALIPRYGSADAVSPVPAQLGAPTGAVAVPPRALAPWQQASQWLLWTALLGGVGALGWMARSLLREAASSDEADKS